MCSMTTLSYNYNSLYTILINIVTCDYPLGQPTNAVTIARGVSWRCVGCHYGQPGIITANDLVTMFPW